MIEAARFSAAALRDRAVNRPVLVISYEEAIILNNSIYTYSGGDMTQSSQPVHVLVMAYARTISLPITII